VPKLPTKLPTKIPTKIPKEQPASNPRSCLAWLVGAAEAAGGATGEATSKAQLIETNWLRNSTQDPNNIITHISKHKQQQAAPAKNKNGASRWWLW
jgi:hypothetical protein